MPRPAINVTPLIDVLLVLLIIFMVITPLKPSAFEARVPAEPPDTAQNVDSHPDTLAVSVGADLSLTLNGEKDLGTANEPEPLIERLRDVFAKRVGDGSISTSFGDERGRPFPDRAERTVFVKASKTTSYGEVAKVVDAVKIAGAYPISLQIDRLD